MSTFRAFGPTSWVCRASHRSTARHSTLSLPAVRFHPSTTATSVRSFTTLPGSTPEFKTFAAAYKQRREYVQLLREGQRTGKWDIERIPWGALWAAAKDAPSDAQKYLDDTANGATDDYYARFMKDLVQTAAIEESKAYAAWIGAKDNWTTHERAFWYGQRVRGAAKYLAGSLLTTLVLLNYLVYQFRQTVTPSNQPSRAETEAGRLPEAYNESLDNTPREVQQ